MENLLFLGVPILKHIRVVALAVIPIKAGVWLIGCLIVRSLVCIKLLPRAEERKERQDRQTSPHLALASTVATDVSYMTPKSNNKIGIGNLASES